MAGIDKEYLGDARLTEGFSVGLLSQEPQLDPAKDARGNVEEGVAPQRAVLKRFEELGAKLGGSLSDDEMATVADEFQKAQDEIEAKGLWDLDTAVDVAMDALRCPPGDQDVATLSGGERRRVRLPAALKPDPSSRRATNHLTRSRSNTERTLKDYAEGQATHDRYFLDTPWILDTGVIPGRELPWLEQKASGLAEEKVR